MDKFFPYTYKREVKKEWQPEPLYIELFPPPIVEEEKKEEKDDIDRGFVVIRL
jgi:hypothetical protein